jgi:cytochrome c-type protein NapC
VAESDKQEKPLSRWQRLWRQPKARYWLGIPAGGALAFVLGIIFWGGFNTVLEATNREEFCISCHEMRDNVYQELKKTIHYTNRTGVRAICSDCHVPKDWGHKMLRKMRASTNEIPNWILGTIDTREKFEAHRLELAQQEWRSMKASNSRECRNCHSVISMDPEKQSKSARKKHDPERMQAKGQTCIDCHKGIAHELPKNYVPEEEKED